MHLTFKDASVVCKLIFVLTNGCMVLILFDSFIASERGENYNEGWEVE